MKMLQHQNGGSTWIHLHFNKGKFKNIKKFLLLIDDKKYEIKSLINWQKYGHLEIHRKSYEILISFCCCDGSGYN